MTSGGARARPGPAPDPNALRRDRPSDKAEWTHLPFEGRLGDPPTWPLPRPSIREKVVWAEEWRRPQAIMWERHHEQREVALYVRASVVAEKTRASTDSRRLVRQCMEGLGISEDGLLKRRWIIDQEPAAVPEPKVSDEARASARERFRVMDGTG